MRLIKFKIVIIKIYMNGVANATPDMRKCLCNIVIVNLYVKRRAGVASRRRRRRSATSIIQTSYIFQTTFSG